MLVINRDIHPHLSILKAMTYKYLKSFVILATVVVWARLLFGTVDVLTQRTPEVGNDEVVATQQNSKEIN